MSDEPQGRSEVGELAGAEGVKLAWRAWLPATPPRAVVVIAHGGLEHSGRYAHVAQRLVAAELAAYAIDFRGHGRSGGTPGQIGRMALLVDDLSRIDAHAAGRHPGLPRFLVAHSLGAMVALEYVSERSAGLAGVVLSGTGIDVSAIPAVTAKVATLLSAVAPNLGLVKLDSSGVSRDPEVVAAYDADPLVFRGKAPVRTAAELLASAKRVEGQLGAVTLPLLVLHGGADQVAAPNGATLVYDGVRSVDRQIKVYDGLYHEIFNEPEQDEVLDDVVGWIEARL